MGFFWPNKEVKLFFRLAAVVSGALLTSDRPLGDGWQPAQGPLSVDVRRRRQPARQTHGQLPRVGPVQRLLRPLLCDARPEFVFVCFLVQQCAMDIIPFRTSFRASFLSKVIPSVRFLICPLEFFSTLAILKNSVKWPKYSSICKSSSPSAALSSSDAHR